tara:strand:+ start:828 stop:1430 length:603 start_codon:yes stop_codon:yes gene_type:complete
VLQQAVPVQEEPRHQLVLDDEVAFILDVQIPPGDTTLYHTHADPIFYVSIGTSRTRSQVMGRDWVGPGEGLVSSPGRVFSNIRYADRPVTHRVNNVGDGLFRLIAVINRSHGPSADSAVRSPRPIAMLPSGFEVEIDNHWFRSFRGTLEPGASSTLHRHALPVVTVQVADGTWLFHIAGTEHRLENPGDTSLELVEIEIR